MQSLPSISKSGSTRAPSLDRRQSPFVNQINLILLAGITLALCLLILKA